MTVSETYRIAYAPRLPSGQAGARLLGELLVSQRALWQALYFSRPNATLSVVWVCSDRGRIEVYVVCRDDGATESSPMPVKELLPIEYGWEAVATIGLQARLDELPLQYSARLMRRVQFANLASTQMLVRNAQATPQGSEASPPSVGSHITGTRLLEGIKRRLPEKTNLALFAMRDPITAGLLGRWCIPVLAEVTDLYPNRRRLCEELQRNSPAVMALTLHPVPHQCVEQDKEQAMLYSRCLDDLGSGLANAGFASVSDLYKAYHRYLLGKAGLSHLTMCVAAASRPQAAAIAHSLSTRSGGMKTFNVFLREYKAEMLAAPVIDMDRGSCNSEDSALVERLKEEGIDLPKDQTNREFLQRLPHFYTLDEMETLLRLPFGDEEGLPGLETRPLPPFYSSAVHLHSVKDGDVYLTPPPDEVRIGRVETSSIRGSAAETDSRARWHTIPRTDLCKHALIVGSTGSGKTVTTTFIVRELVRLNIPFLVIEPVKTEYAHALSKVCPSLLRWRLEPEPGKSPWNDPCFLALDPMRLQPGVTVARHVSYLKSCFEAAFPLEPWAALILENGLMAYYVGSKENGCCGLDLFSHGGQKAHRLGLYAYGNKKGREGAVYPSFETFTEFFLNKFIDDEFPRHDGGGRVDWIEQNRKMFERRFRNLSHGPLGRAFAKADEFARATPKDQPLRIDPVKGLGMFSQPAIIELDAVSDTEQKALIMAFMMTFLFEKRQVEDAVARKNRDNSRDPKHVLIIEEAHRLLANSSGAGRGDKVVGQDSKAKAVGLFVDMLAEIRAWRQGIFIVEQIPTKIVPEAVKNTNLKIMLRTTAKEDRDYLGSAMNFNEEQKQFVTNLRAEPGKGIQYVVFEEGVDQPVLLTLPLDVMEGEEIQLFDRYFRKPGGE